MVNCPLCNQPMEGIDPEEYHGYADMYICGACQVEQAIFWDSGERVLLERGHVEPDNEIG
ncbi:MAG TPA: hypothetical protein GX008_03050 [Firmicutes bacterium]|jgi:hypothetical protein|nr:MAG: hypothetical protein AA931_02225 [Peptococcaceae bacterium 1109]HHT72671.1 hypothetical protein [Bacillota bacterium]